MREVAELKVDVPELRAQMGRANLNQGQLAELSGVHRNTISSILRSGKADLESIAAITLGLNQALRAEGQAELNPIDLMKMSGFPSPQMAAPRSARQPILA